MRSMTMLIAALLPGTFACTSSVTEDGPEDFDDPEGRAAGRYIVTLTDQTSTGTAWVEDHGVHAELVFDHSVRGCVLRGSPEMAEELRRDPTVARVEQDVVLRLGEEAVAGPSDQIRASAAQFVPGGVTRVGGPHPSLGGLAFVVDTGIDFDHADLSVLGDLSRNFVAAEPNDGEDLNGHGTHVAGIIGAKDNDIDVVGVAPNTPVVSVRVLDSNNSGLESEVIAGVDYVASRARPGDVANLSLSSTVRVPALDEAVLRAADLGILFALAAGNETADASSSSPAGVDHPNVFTVSAIRDTDCLAAFSNFGSPVDFAAPGEGIISTALGGGVVLFNGTSQASPHVAGILLANGGRVDSDGTACLDPDGIPDPIAHFDVDGDDGGQDGEDGEDGETISCPPCDEAFEECQESAETNSDFFDCERAFLDCALPTCDLGEAADCFTELDGCLDTCQTDDACFDCELAFAECL